MEDKNRKTENLDLIIFGEGQRICFVECLPKYKLGDLVCPTVYGIDTLYIVNLIANINDSKRAYYAKLL